MKNYRDFIVFDNNTHVNETAMKIINLSLPNIIDFKKRFPDKEIKFLNDFSIFECTEDEILDSLLRDIHKHFTEDYPPSLESIFIEQHFKVCNALNKFDREYLIKRLLNYTPLLGCIDREKKFKQNVNNYLEIY